MLALRKVIIERRIMNKLIDEIFRWLTGSKEGKDVSLQPEPFKAIEKKPTEIPKEESTESNEANKPSKKINKKKDERCKKTRIKGGIIKIDTASDIRDVMELMEVPFVSLSKNRTKPIVYESQDGKSKLRISCHPPYHMASIYDWDIILFVASKMQEIINSGEDIPPRTLIIPRNQLLRSIHRHDGKKQENDLKSSLSRLNTTLIETTISNEDGRYEAGFGFIDSWGYTNRKDVKEFRITISQWLYEIICHNGSLLKVHPEYFKITSGLKRFLYRTARKHVGTQNESWPFSVETLYKKSGSEQILRCFKRDLKKAVRDNDIPGYRMEWIEKDGKTLVLFRNLKKVSKKDTTPSDGEAKKISKPSSNLKNSEQKRIVSDLISSSIKRIK
jgi:plasmid replication initiation protein